MHRSRGLRVAALLAIAAGLVACETQRTITVTSEPAGALVFLNDEEVGRTPVTVPFTFYGTYSVRLELSGYDALWTKKKAAAPFWELPGPDLVALLVPDKRVDLHWHYDLKPIPSVDGVSAIDEGALLDRAQQMRGMLTPVAPATATQPAPPPNAQP
jgi:hypothetical protein